MSVPASLSPSPVTSLGSHSYQSLFEDDFSTGKLVLKTKAATVASGIANFKGTFDLSALNVSHEVKVQFPFRRYYVWLGLKENNQKVHVDFGEFNIIKKFRLYANARKDNSSFHQFRLGAVHDSQKCKSHFRIENNKDQWGLTSSTLAQNQDYLLGLAGTYNLSTQQLTRLDLIGGVQQKDYDLYLRHYTKTFSLGKLHADLIYRADKDTTYGTEFTYDNSQPGLLLAVARKVNGYNLKLKTDVLNKQVNFALKGKLLDNWNLTLSSELPVSSAYKNKTVLPLPLSFTLEANI